MVECIIGASSMHHLKVPKWIQSYCNAHTREENSSLRTATGFLGARELLEAETGVRSARMVDTPAGSAATVVGGRPDERLGRRLPGNQAVARRAMRSPRTRFH